MLQFGFWFSEQTSMAGRPNMMDNTVKQFQSYLGHWLIHMYEDLNKKPPISGGRLQQNTKRN
jgi:hypothetical protein